MSEEKLFCMRPILKGATFPKDCEKCGESWVGNCYGNYSVCPNDKIRKDHYRKTGKANIYKFISMVKNKLFK